MQLYLTAEQEHTIVFHLFFMLKKQLQFLYFFFTASAFLLFGKLNKWLQMSHKRTFFFQTKLQIINI